MTNSNIDLSSVTLADGSLLRFSSVGSYPIVYLDSKDRCLCNNCASQTTEEDDPIVKYDIIEDQSEDVFCDSCSDQIVYSDPWYVGFVQDIPNLRLVLTDEVDQDRDSIWNVYVEEGELPAFIHLISNQLHRGWEYLDPNDVGLDPNYVVLTDHAMYDGDDNLLAVGNIYYYSDSNSIFTTLFTKKTILLTKLEKQEG